MAKLHGSKPDDIPQNAREVLNTVSEALPFAKKIFPGYSSHGYCSFALPAAGDAAAAFADVKQLLSLPDWNSGVCRSGLSVLLAQLNLLITDSAKVCWDDLLNECCLS